MRGPVTDPKLAFLIQERDHILISINLAENGGRGSLDVLQRELKRVDAMIAEQRRAAYAGKK